MADIKARLWLYEGTMEYQKTRGYFKQGKFWMYKDTEGYDTIGAGHKVLPSERENSRMVLLQWMPIYYWHGILTEPKRM